MDPAAVDDGVVRYGLDRREHGALRSGITLLPPHVPHDGRSAGPGGFAKRVVYLDLDVLDERLIGRAVDGPTVSDPLLRRRIEQLHAVLAAPDRLESTGRLALVVERLTGHLRFGGPPPRPEASDPGVAGRLRELIDAALPGDLALDEAAARLEVSPTYLIRAFSRADGLPPHQYLTGRWIDLARGLLLAGRPAAEVAPLVGFYDQSHLTRHFRRVLGTTPGRFARQPRPGPPGQSSR